MPTESRPRTTQAMGITRRSLESLSEEVGIRSIIKDKTNDNAAPSDGEAEEI
jgi:hypothetical protein